MSKNVRSTKNLDPQFDPFDIKDRLYTNYKAPPRPTTVKLKCLGCDGIFKARGLFNRLCSRCLNIGDRDLIRE